MTGDEKTSTDGSDTSSGDDSSHSEAELMITTRERRKTAGNRYSQVVAQEQADEDEEDDVALLFAEAEGEDEEYNSDEADDEADMSSSDDDDQGPNVAADEMEGEQEILKQAKVERQKKRKADMALTTMGAVRKKPRIDPTLHRAPDKPKPSKRKERVSWLPGEATAPGRTSLRKQTVDHRKVLLERLKENEEQRKWENPDLKSENRDAFISACSHHHYDPKQHIVPHGSYLVNLAAKDADQAAKSYKFFLNDLKRCESLGIRHYNFHPGATNGAPLADAISRVAKNLNKALEETSTVVPLLENMAGTESIVGSRFSDLAQIIAEIKPEYLGRIGICIDTCHTFAAGYDLRTAEAFQKTFKELDDEVGLKYLKAMHLNDSKGMFGSKKDLHQNIGTGFLGLRTFHSIMNEPRLTNIPLILETPCEKVDPKDPKKTVEDKTVWSREIKLLESLIGMDPESDEYKQLEDSLAEQGKAERDKMEQWQTEKEKKEREKVEKAKQKVEKAEKGQKSIAGMFGEKGRKKKARTPSEASSGSD